MKDTVIKGSGNSRSIRFPPNALTVYPDWPTFVAAAASQFGAPCDIGGLNDAGVLTHGTDLNKQNLLTDETAALLGLDETAVPDDVFAVLATAAVSGKKVVIFTVKGENGAPLQGVRMLGLLDINGATPVTDQNGMCTAIISAATTVTANSPYLDTSDVTLTVSVPEKLASQVSVTIPGFDISEIREVTESGDYKVSRNHNALVCCIQGGTGGTGGSKSGGQNTPGGAGGAGGSAGKMKNENISLAPGVTYSAIVGSGGKGGSGSSVNNSAGNSGESGGNTSFNDVSSENGTGTVPISMPELENQYCVAGENGNTGGSGSGENNTSRGGNGGKGGDGGAGSSGANGSSGGTSNSSSYNPYGGRGGNGGIGGPGSGGGGGGGGGTAGLVTTGTVYPSGNGGAGGPGGPGIILIKFLD